MHHPKSALAHHLAHYQDSQPWRANAACKGANTELFFQPTRLERAARAKEIASQYCDQCPVTDQCRAEAQRHPHTEGIWAGDRYRAVHRLNPEQLLAALRLLAPTDLVTMTTAELADELGFTTTHITRTLQALRKTDQIAITHNPFTIRILAPGPAASFPDPPGRRPNRQSGHKPTNTHRRTP